MDTINKSELMAVLEELVQELEAEELTKNEDTAEDLELSEASEESTESEEQVEKAEDEEDEEDDKEDEDEDLKKKPMKKAQMKKEEVKEKEEDEDEDHEDEDQDKKLIREMIDDSKKTYKMKKFEDEIAKLSKALEDKDAEIAALKKSIEEMKPVEVKKSESPAPASEAPLVKSEEVQPSKILTKEEILNKCFGALEKAHNDGDHLEYAKVQNAMLKFDATGEESLVKAYIG